MFSSRTTDNLAFVSRQLAGMSNGRSLDAALAALSENCPVEYARDIEYLRELLAGGQSTSVGLGPNPYKAIAGFLPLVGNQRDRLFRGFVDFVRQSKVIFETYWVSINGLVLYLFVLASALVLYSIGYWLAVVPSFSELYASSGSSPPEISQWVFGFGNAGAVILSVALLSLVALTALGVSAFSRRVQRLTPLPRWALAAPIVGTLAEAYNLGLFLNYSRLLRECEVDAEQAIAAAATASNQLEALSLSAMKTNTLGHANLPTLTELGVAAKLGNFDSELAHQCEQHAATLSLVLVEARDRFSLLLKVLAFLIIAVLLIAMYVPIFELGALV